MARRRRGSAVRRSGRSYGGRTSGYVRVRTTRSRRAASGRGRSTGRAGTVRVIVQTAPQQPIGPVMLPDQSALVMPGAPVPRRPKF